MEIKTRDELLDYMPEGMVWAEIGVFKGEFSEQILSKTNPKMIHLVDIWDRPACNGGKDGNYDEHIADMRQVYEDLGTKYCQNPKVALWRMTGTNFFHNFKKYLPMKMLDAVYIDAEHDYNSVIDDLRNAYQVTRRYILGHDYNPTRFPGCVKAVDEFCDYYKLKITHLTEDGCPTYLIPLQ